MVVSHLCYISNACESIADVVPSTDTLVLVWSHVYTVRPVTTSAIILVTKNDKKETKYYYAT